MALGQAQSGHAFNNLTVNYHICFFFKNSTNSLEQWFSARGVFPKERQKSWMRWLSWPHEEDVDSAPLSQPQLSVDRGEGWGWRRKPGDLMCGNQPRPEGHSRWAQGLEGPSELYPGGDGEPGKGLE